MVAAVSNPWLWWGVLLGPPLNLLLSSLAVAQFLKKDNRFNSRLNSYLLVLPVFLVSIVASVATFTLLQNAPLVAAFAVMATPFLVEWAEKALKVDDVLFFSPSSTLACCNRFSKWGLVLGSVGAVTWKIAAAAGASMPTRAALAIAVPIILAFVEGAKKGIIKVPGLTPPKYLEYPKPTSKPTSKPTTKPATKPAANA